MKYLFITLLFVACNTVHKTTDKHTINTDSVAVHTYDSTATSSKNKIETHEETNHYDNEADIVLDSAGSTLIINYPDATSIENVNGSIVVKGPAKANFKQRGTNNKKDSSAKNHFDSTGVKRGDSTQAKEQEDNSHTGKTSARVPWLFIVTGGLIILIIAGIVVYKRMK